MYLTVFCDTILQIIVLIDILADYVQCIIIVIYRLWSLLYQSCKRLYRDIALYHSVFMLHCFIRRGCLGKEARGFCWKIKLVKGVYHEISLPDFKVWQKSLRLETLTHTQLHSLPIQPPSNCHRQTKYYFQLFIVH